MENNFKHVIVILILPVLFLSCAYHSPKDSNWVWPIPDTDIYVTTSKRVNDVFYVFFSNKDTVAVLSDTIDYIKMTNTTEINIIFNPENEKDIHYYIFLGEGGAILEEHKFKFNLIQLKEKAEINNFIIGNKVLSPYRLFKIDARYYYVAIDGKPVKEGDIWGGWTYNEK